MLCIFSLLYVFDDFKKNVDLCFDFLVLTPSNSPLRGRTAAARAAAVVCETRLDLLLWRIPSLRLPNLPSALTTALASAVELPSPAGEGLGMGSAGLGVVLFLRFYLNINRQPTC